MATHALSILLLKDSVKKPEDALAAPTKLKSIQVTVGDKSGVLFWRAAVLRPPKWTSLFDGDTADAIKDVISGNAAGLLVLEADSRYFAITFGYGRVLLRAGIHEENFGLKVVLNSVMREKLRSIDSQSLEAIPLNRRSQSGRAADLGAFGIDVERDVLYAASGEPHDKTLGKHLSGKDSLRLSIPITLANIPALLAKVLALSESTAYRTSGFSWVDNVSEVRDPIRKAQLDLTLENKIKAGELDQTWLVPPEIIEWADVDGFRYQRPIQGELLEELAWDTYLEFLSSTGSELAMETMRKQVAYCISASSGESLDHWTIYRCIYAEIDDGKQAFLLNNGRWYEIERDFLGNLNKDVGSIPMTSMAFPAYKDEDDDEEAYNKRVAAETPTLFACMDARNISYGGGSNKIEFCDLYTTDQKLIHVKRYGGSSVLSHLFAQGVASAEPLLSSPEFRVNVNSELPASHQLQNPAQRPNPQQFEVIYAIAQRKPGPRPRIPVFSRITLRNARDRLRTLDMSVALAVIEDISAPKKKNAKKP